MNIWFTSDSHFNHNKDFIWKVRGFENVEEMNEAIIERWNSVVKDDDIVYHLGDFLLGEDYTVWSLNNISRLKGKKYLVIGNHDTDKKIDFYKEHCFFEEISMGYRLKAKKKVLLLTHYPMLVTNHNYKTPIWTIHGHTHQNLNFDNNIVNGYHVGVDSHNCYPINLEDMMNQIREEEGRK